MHAAPPASTIQRPQSSFPQRRAGAVCRLGRRIGPAALCVLAALVPSLDVLAGQAAMPPTTTSKVSEVGPLDIGGRNCFVRIVTAQVESGAAVNFPETVSRYEIVDASGKVLFAEEYPLVLHVHGFDDSIALEAHRLMGKSGEGLILFRDAAPSAPGSGRSFRIFGRRGRELSPFTRWLTVYGTVGPLRPAGERCLRLLPGDVIEISVWTGWFGVVVPVAVDLARGAVRVPRGARIYPVQAEGPVFEEDPGEVRLFAGPSPDSGSVTVRVTRGSRIEYLGVSASAGLVAAGGEERDWRELVVEETPWLRIRVDGKVGWIRDPESLMAVGLRQAG